MYSFLPALLIHIIIARETSITCPYCGSDEVIWMPQYRYWYCINCRRYLLSENGRRNEEYIVLKKLLEE